ncbi:hypothetical protein C8Q80DRAFT_1269923 [Daedaleopsis nitida]|nr:hypothetical protein C8Q80DRAFT_1269923 [Daedaleopsis nitida]
MNGSQELECNNCYITGDKKALFACSQCKAMRYCSRECQKADWQSHKPLCQNNGKLESILKAHSGSSSGLFDRLMLVDGISIYELDQRLEKWVRFHNTNLMIATIHALRIPVDISRARTHLLYVSLAPRGQDEHQGHAAKFFRVVDAVVIEVEDALRRPSPWPESVMQLRTMAEGGERSGHGTSTAAMIECPPLAVQTVPFGSLTDRTMRSEFQDDNWKAGLMEAIEEGKKARLVKAAAPR